ncbi:MAG: hypothetical protein ABJK28_08675 [Algibacter sp.]
MDYIRNNTFKLTKDLSIYDLDYNFDNLSNSIGTLLLHITALEFKFQLNHFYKRDITKNEYEKYANAMPKYMNTRKIHGNNLNFYLNELKQIRRKTLLELKHLNDEWLFKEIISSKGNNLGNYYYLLKHIINDEISHQGQIKIILKRLKHKKLTSSF